MEFKITKEKVKELAQEIHNDIDENGDFDHDIQSMVTEDLLEEFEEWLNEEVDWAEIESDILEDDRNLREEIEDFERTKREVQGWK